MKEGYGIIVDANGNVVMEYVTGIADGATEYIKYDRHYTIGWERSTERP